MGTDNRELSDPGRRDASLEAHTPSNGTDPHTSREYIFLSAKARYVSAHDG